MTVRIYRGSPPATVELVDEAPPAPPPPLPTDGFEQYVLNDDSGALGCSRRYYSRELEMRWDAALGRVPESNFGNWIDAIGARQGLTPYATITIAANAPNASYVTSDVTDLVRKWVTSGHNRGIYLRSEANASFSANATFAGRVSANPPRLSIVTTTGAYELDGMLAAWAVSADAGMDARANAPARKGNVVLAHWRGLLDALDGDVVSATLKLWLVNHWTGGPTVIQVMETDPPFLHVGGQGEAPRLGLAAEVGETNLRAHPDCIQAGDFRKENWVTGEDSQGYYAGKSSLPKAPCGGYNEIPTRGADGPGKQTAEFLADGSLRWDWEHGNGGNGSTSQEPGDAFYTAGPGLKQNDLVPRAGDPQFSVDPASGFDELYARVYIMLEEDFYSRTDGIKGGLGFDYRIGYKSNTASWQTVGGNSGTPMTGRARIVLQGQRFANGAVAPVDQWEYSGGCARQHQGNYFGVPSGRPHEMFRPVATMISHLGPFDFNAPYANANEEIIGCGRNIVRKGEWHCIEWYMRQNSIDLSAPDEYGNGIANRDGVLRLWVDGVQRWEKTDFAFRHHPDMVIAGAWIEWLHGGVRPPAAGDTPHVRMNHYAVARRYIGPAA